MEGILKKIGQEMFVTQGENHYPIVNSENLEAETIVEFDIIDEFTNPELYEGVGWGDGIKYALIKK